jgi:hypothetical protein
LDDAEKWGRVIGWVVWRVMRLEGEYLLRTTAQHKGPQPKKFPGLYIYLVFILIRLFGISILFGTTLAKNYIITSFAKSKQKKTYTPIQSTRKPKMEIIYSDSNN